MNIIDRAELTAFLKSNPATADMSISKQEPPEGQVILEQYAEVSDQYGVIAAAAKWLLDDHWSAEWVEFGYIHKLDRKFKTPTCAIRGAIAQRKQNHQLLQPASSTPANATRPV